MKIVNYFLDALYQIDNYETVPYYLESKIKDYINFLSTEDVKIILNFIMQSENPVRCFKYLRKNRLLSKIFIYLDMLYNIPQKKHKKIGRASCRERV